MRLAPWMVALLLLTGCSGSRDPALIINNQQSLVMDPSVLSAGITAAPPSLTTDRGRLRAYSILSNDHPALVTVYYRFYWYDAQGLDVIPFAATRMLIVPPGGEARVEAVNGNPEAKHARLYLFLQ
ncbi:outer membrane lipoprotein that is part of a salvage cluster [Candidatus Sodalis pierantonius str. SOPE]|uniref:Outer membrane lipoprotein that is part of a salvage cluster n=1 Tax=Candidatus Sodalis pierantonii str. SOPE TaxID=2342 RepID=W0HNJ0_9GAMM|nr:outer membrane lipoprotein that is part of a salvage cluster [Candidatus Sodalis pierantonius str. SOPE]